MKGVSKTWLRVAALLLVLQQRWRLAALPLCEAAESLILGNRSPLITASLQLAIEAPSPILISVRSYRDPA